MYESAYGYNISQVNHEFKIEGMQILQQLRRSSPVAKSTKAQLKSTANIHHWKYWEFRRR